MPVGLGLGLGLGLKSIATFVNAKHHTRDAQY